MMEMTEHTGQYRFWLLDANGEKVDPDNPTIVRSGNASDAIRNFRRRTGRKAATTRLNVDIAVQEVRVPIAPERIENVQGRGILYKIHPDGSWRNK